MLWQRRAKAAETAPDAALGPRPRLVRLIVKNFRCIGASPATIDLDDIVVWSVQQHRQSSVLKAYEVIMSEGSNAGTSPLTTSHLETVNPDELPEIELHTVVYDNSPGPEWMEKTASEKCLQGALAMASPGAPGCDADSTFQENRCGDGTRTKRKYRGVPLGSRIPGDRNRIRVDAFASPDEQAG